MRLRQHDDDQTPDHALQSLQEHEYPPPEDDIDVIDRNGQKPVGKAVGQRQAHRHQRQPDQNAVQRCPQHRHGGDRQHHQPDAGRGRFVALREQAQELDVKSPVAAAGGGEFFAGFAQLERELAPMRSGFGIRPATALDHFRGDFAHGYALHKQLGTNSRMAKKC